MEEDGLLWSHELDDTFANDDVTRFHFLNLLDPLLDEHFQSLHLATLATLKMEERIKKIDLEIAKVKICLF